MTLKANVTLIPKLCMETYKLSTIYISTIGNKMDYIRHNDSLENAML
jgi:hypothetical protein